MPEYDEIFDDEYMNEMLLNPDLYGLEENDENENNADLNCKNGEE